MYLFIMCLGSVSTDVFIPKNLSAKTFHKAYPTENQNKTVITIHKGNVLCPSSLVLQPQDF